jgi:hypothetical protein
VTESVDIRMMEDGGRAGADINGEEWRLETRRSEKGSQRRGMHYASVRDSRDIIGVRVSTLLGEVLQADGPCICTTDLISTSCLEDQGPSHDGVDDWGAILGIIIPSTLGTVPTGVNKSSPNMGNNLSIMVRLHWG